MTCHDRYQGPKWEIAGSENVVTSTGLHGTFFVTGVIPLCYNIGGRVGGIRPPQ